MNAIEVGAIWIGAVAILGPLSDLQMRRSTKRYIKRDLRIWRQAKLEDANARGKIIYALQERAKGETKMKRLKIEHDLQVLSMKQSITMSQIKSLKSDLRE